jgi:hypothetical protein
VRTIPEYTELWCTFAEEQACKVGHTKLSPGLEIMDESSKGGGHVAETNLHREIHQTL